MDGALGGILIEVLIIVAIFVVFFVVYFLYTAKRKKNELERIKDLRVFQVSIPKEAAAAKQNETPKDFKEIIGVADQFFSSLSQLYDSNIGKKIYGLYPQIVFEIIAMDETIEFYCISPQELDQVVERQINSFWPTARILKKTVPNIFKSKTGEMVSCAFGLHKKFVIPIRTYKYLESDPLNSLTNALSKLGKDSAMAIQLIVKPISDDWRRAAGITAKKVMEGKSIATETWWMKIIHFIFEGLGNIFHGSSSGGAASSSKGPATMDIQKPVQLTPIQEQSLKMLNEKSSKTGLGTNIRIVSVAPDHGQAILNLKNVTTSFGQFSSPDLNGFKVKIAPNSNIRDYILRRFIDKGMILNSEELASVFHFPSHFVETPNIAWLLAKEMSPPTNLPNEGVIIGESIYRGQVQPVKIKIDDRRRHIFMIGKTGVGKTTLYTNMIEQDMLEGRGCCFIDPLGDAIEDLLGKIPPNRLKDVILFDPSDVEFPMGLNLLEWRTADERDFLIQEAIQIFYKLFDPGQTGIVGPQWEHWFRNAALTIMAQPGGGTLIDVPRIFTDDAFRTRLIGYIKDPIVKAFWQQQLAKTADFHKSEMYNYFISKFGRFTTNELMRNIIGQKQSSFDLRRAMDEGRILLINLSKGKIGEVNSSLLGMILVSKIQMAAFSRANIPEENRKDFYLYVDEFQNFTTDSFASILSEARKYRLNLAIANQYIAQLTEQIRDAVIGNAGTMICYRIGAADAEFMVKEFPAVTAEDMVNLDRFNTYTKLLIDGTPSKPFSMRGIKSKMPSSEEIRSKARAISRTLAQPKAQIESQIKEAIQAMGPPPPTGSNGPLNNL
ncbi:MAG: hypothetical protein ABSE91_03745 [Patescibacteria group bacterium]